MVQVNQYASKKIVKFVMHNTSVDARHKQDNLRAGLVFLSNVSHSKEEEEGGELIEKHERGV